MRGIPEITAAGAQQQRVLVVDDDRALRLHARAVLRAAGFEVCEAGSGEQAIEMLARENIDAVLLDVRMPGMDGFETCRRIREQCRGEFLPVIVVTGLDDMDAVETAYSAGATDFVVKPINWTILKHRIRYTMNTRAMAEDLVATSDHRHGLLKTIPDAVLSLDGDGRVVEARLPNAGWAASGALFSVGHYLPDSLPKSAAGLAQAAISEVRKGVNQTSFEFETDTDNGSRSYEVYLAPGGRGEMVALVRDFTERRRAEAEIRHLAYFDRITGLPNREMLQQHVDKMARDAMIPGGRVVMARLELQGLDSTRSLLGNRHADKLLNLCADRLHHLLDAPGDPDVCSRSMVGRVSDAGFIVVRDDLPDASSLQSFAECLYQHMTSSYILGDYEINITARLGIAILDKQQGFDTSELFDQAEMAMVQSQSAPAFYSSETTKKRKSRARLVMELQSAVNNGDLYLEYQPKVDAKEGRLLGVEALVRWNHPSRGAISPAEFIPMAEENGLILPIGEFVLEQACSQSREWKRSGRSVVPIAVNFSGHQFSKKGLVSSVMATLARYEISKGDIEIELTETVAMDDCSGIHHVLQKLHDVGIRTAIDDFGTGYSSLSNLRQFQFHTIKIDRSFIADLDVNPSARSIIRGIIGMGHALGMQVVAEGVEQAHQLEYLREQRCDTVQGYLTGRPVRGEIIQGLLQSA